MSARDDLAALEAGMMAGDELMARVIADLRGLLDAGDELALLERRRSVMRAACVSFVAEATGIAQEARATAAAHLFGSAPAHVWHQ